MYIDQISVFLENRVGTLSDITGVLAESDIDIRGICVSDTVDFGILRCIVDDPQKGVEALTENGFKASITKVLAVEMADVPGGLHRVLSILKDAEISVDYIYSFNKLGVGSAGIIIKVADPQAAADALREYDIYLYEPEELLPTEENKKSVNGRLREMLNDSDRL